MKRIICIVLLFAALLCMAACGNEVRQEQGTTGAENSTAERTEEDGVKKDSGSKENTDILVAYFSCTGTTKSLAEYAAGYLNADLYEIEAETPYTSKDLDYNTSGSRANKEQDDAGARPAISGKVEDMDKYQTVVLAYPKMEYQNCCV